MKEYIDISKCSPFEQMMVYIMGTFSHEDLRDDYKQAGFLGIGELERLGRFGIKDFANSCKWFDGFIALDEDDKKTIELENQFQKVAEEAFKLYEMIENQKEEQ